MPYFVKLIYILLIKGRLYLKKQLGSIRFICNICIE